MFLPEPLYGNRLDVDFCGQTAAWHFEPFWSYEKIRACTRVICSEEKEYFSRPEGMAILDGRSLLSIREDAEILPNRAAENAACAFFGPDDTTRV